jgi:hypothetical protein
MISGVQTMLRTWMTAVFLCLLGIVGILNLPGTDVAEPRTAQIAYTIARFDPVPDILVLGSSLSMLAFPPQIRIPAAEKQEADRVAIRIALPCSQPAELARVLDEAVRSGVSTVLFEVNHFLYSLKPCNPDRGLSTRLTDFSRALRQRLEWALFGSKSALGEVAHERVFLARTYDGDPRKLALHYPRDLSSPKAFDLLEDPMSEAVRRGIEVIFIVMPRSRTAARFLGAEFDALLDTGLVELRSRFSGKVWEPARAWPDHYFADWAHMNEAGRARLLSELPQAIGGLQ